MFVRNDATRDSRVLREAGSLPCGSGKVLISLAASSAFGDDDLLPVFGGDFNILICQCRIIDSGDQRASHVLEPFESMKRRTGLHRDCSYCRFQFLQSATGADKGAGGSQSRDEVCNAAFGLFPNFQSGALVVGTPVRWIVVLVRIEIFLGLSCRQLTRDNLCAVGGLQRIRFNQLDAIAA